MEPPIGKCCSRHKFPAHLSSERFRQKFLRERGRQGCSGLDNVNYLFAWFRAIAGDATQERMHTTAVKMMHSWKALDRTVSNAAIFSGQQPLAVLAAEESSLENRSKMGGLLSCATYGMHIAARLYSQEKTAANQSVLRCPKSDGVWSCPCL